MITDHWPLFGLRLTTPRLEMRVPGTVGDQAGLAAAAAAGIHDPATMPFVTPWTDDGPEKTARNVLQWMWSTWAGWAPESWQLQFVVVAEGTVIGTQSVGAKQFPLLREVSTGSWLGLAHHGKGYGTEMRAAVLHLAFEGLGAEFATSEAFDHNAASYGVSRRLGYADDGIARHAVRGEAVVGRRVRLDRAAWAVARRVPVEVVGLDPCLPMFGLDRTA